MAVITKEDLLKKQSEYLAQREQTMAMLHVISGAVQDIEHWLKEIEASDNRPEAEA